MCVYVCRGGVVRGRRMSSNSSLLLVQIFLKKKYRVEMRHRGGAWKYQGILAAQMAWGLTASYYS